MAYVWLSVRFFSEVFMQVVPLEYYLILSVILFSIGVAGVLTRRSIIVLLMCVELMLNSVNLSLIAFSQYIGDAHGQVLVLFVMAIAAAEAAVGLAIVIALFRLKKSVNIEDINLLKL